MLKWMIEQRRHAARARYRIKAWKLTEPQATALAEEMPYYFGFNVHETVESMKAGCYGVLGAQIIVR